MKLEDIRSQLRKAPTKKVEKPPQKDNHAHATRAGPTSGPIPTGDGTHYHRTGIGATDNVRFDGELHRHVTPDGAFTGYAR